MAAVAQTRVNPVPDPFTSCLGPFTSLQNWDDMMADLLKPDSERTCDAAVAGMSETSDRLAAGEVLQTRISMLQTTACTFQCYHAGCFIDCEPTHLY